MFKLFGRQFSGSPTSKLRVIRLSSLPREYIDDFVKFASNETHWRQWPRWFAIHAAGLSRALDRAQFRLIRNDPQREVARYLEACGIEVVPVVPDVFLSELTVDSPPVGEVDELEYAIYTSLFQTHLFTFERGNTSICRLTGTFNIRARYFTSETVERAFAGTSVDRDELFASFCGRNVHRYFLAPRFRVPHGYMLEDDSERPTFVISRVGLNAAKSEAVVYIACVGCVGYLVAFRRQEEEWSQIGFAGLWVT